MLYSHFNYLLTVGAAGINFPTTLGCNRDSKPPQMSFTVPGPHGGCSTYWATSWSWFDRALSKADARRGKPLSLPLQHIYLAVMVSNPVTGKNFFGMKINSSHEGMIPMLMLTFLFNFFPTHLARLMSIFIGGSNYRASASKFLRDSQGLSVCVCV